MARPATEGPTKGFFGDTIVFLLFVAYSPAVFTWLFTSAIFSGLHTMAFGEPSSKGYESALARGAGYVAVSAPVLAAVAVAVWETVVVTIAIAGKILN